MKALIKTGEISRIFGVSAMTIYNWRREGILKGEKVNGRFIYTREAVEKLLTIKPRISREKMI